MTEVQQGPVGDAGFDPSHGRSFKVGRSSVEVGRFTYGSEKMIVRQWREGANLRIGAFCSIAAGLRVYLGGNHRLDWSTTFPFGHIFARELGGRGFQGHPQSRGDVVIGNDVWVGEHVTILSGVSGDGAVIALNATVTRPVGPYEIWGGTPARLIAPRFPAAISERVHGIRWWDCSVEAIRDMAPLLSAPPDDVLLSALESIATRDRAQKKRAGLNRPSQG